MNIGQFNFKTSLEFGIDEVAEVMTDKVTKVQIKRNNVFDQLNKYVDKRCVYTVSFARTEKGKAKLGRALNTIGKYK